MRLWITQPGDTAGLDARMVGKQVFDGGRCNVLALRGFEQLFGPAGDLQTSFIVDFSQVARLEKTVLGEILFGLLRHLVVAHHVARALDEDLTFLADSLLYVRIWRTHISRTHLPGFGAV